MTYKQPPLTNDWGVPFQGRAMTTTGHVWWYEDRERDGSVRRYPLRPVLANAEKEDANG